MIIAMCVHPKSLSCSFAVWILKQNVIVLITFELNHLSLNLNQKSKLGHRDVCESQVFIMELCCGDFETKCKHFDYF